MYLHLSDYIKRDVAKKLPVSFLRITHSQLSLAAYAIGARLVTGIAS